MLDVDDARVPREPQLGRRARRSSASRSSSARRQKARPRDGRQQVRQRRAARPSARRGSAPGCRRAMTTPLPRIGLGGTGHGSPVDEPTGSAKTAPETGSAKPAPASDRLRRRRPRWPTPKATPPPPRAKRRTPAATPAKPRAAKPRRPTAPTTPRAAPTPVGAAPPTRRALGMRFAKYHGLGNDFLVVDLRARGARRSRPPRRIRTSCARCAIASSASAATACSRSCRSATGAIARMRVLNADGSEAEMCGNGIRCVAQGAPRSRRHRASELAIEPVPGASCASSRGDGVTVAMGRPRLDARRDRDDGTAHASAVSIRRSPTALARSRRCRWAIRTRSTSSTIARAKLRELAETIGPRSSTTRGFHSGTNVEFARVSRPRPSSTSSCGSAAAGSRSRAAPVHARRVVAAIVNGRADERSPTSRVHLLGGALSIRVLPGMTDVQMHGPADARRSTASRATRDRAAAERSVIRRRLLLLLLGRRLLRRRLRVALRLRIISAAADNPAAEAAGPAGTPCCG